MPESVVIDQATFVVAQSLAVATLKKFEKTKGHYNNTLNSHLRGKIGELACAGWMTAKGVRCEPVFQDLERIADADLVTPAMRLDVKTWDERFWDVMGRCVAVVQLGKLRAKADGVIWCVTPQALEPDIHVHINGWSTLDDIEQSPRRLTGPAGKRQVDNHQVDIESVRPLDSLLARASR